MRTPPPARGTILHATEGRKHAERAARDRRRRDGLHDDACRIDRDELGGTEAAHPEASPLHHHVTQVALEVKPTELFPSRPRVTRSPDSHATWMTCAISSKARPRGSGQDRRPRDDRSFGNVDSATIAPAFPQRHVNAPGRVLDHAPWLVVRIEDDLREELLSGQNRRSRRDRDPDSRAIAVLPSLDTISVPPLIGGGADCATVTPVSTGSEAGPPNSPHWGLPDSPLRHETAADDTRRARR